MSASRPRVIVTRRLPEPVEARMAELFNTTLNDDDHPFTKGELIEAARAAEVLVPTVTDVIDAEVIAAGAAAGHLKLIASFGAGVDHIDMAAARERGIIVTNTPGVLTEDTADMAMALILAVPRRLVEGVRVMEEGAFHGWTPTWMLGRRIKGKKLGIVGMGRIGQAIAERAKAFGLEINYHNRRAVSPAIADRLGATYWDSLDQMLAHMDIISINTPKTPATYHLLSRRRLKLLQPHAFVVNVSRGELIDEDALAELVEKGAIGGAGLDVFENEPGVNQKLLEAPNVVLIPHMSSATLESRVEMGERIIINIRFWMTGDRPPDRVLPEETAGAV